MKKLTLAEKREKLSLKKQRKKTKKPSQTELIQLQEYFQSRRYNDAKRLAESITEKFPYHTYSFKILATILALQGRIAESVVIGEKVVSIDTHDADAYYNLGLAYQELGKLDKAEECYKAVVILKPKHADAHNNLGNTLHDRGKLQLAELHIKEAIAIKPDFTEAYNNLGLTLHELGRLEEALVAYKGAIENNPDFSGLNANIALALSGLQFTKFRPDLQDLFIRLLEAKTTVRPGDICLKILSLLRFDPDIKAAFSMYGKGIEPPPLNQAITHLSKAPLLLKLMEICPLSHIEFELPLKRIRSDILLNIYNLRNRSELLIFQNSLALQCFTNEYIYEYSDAEANALGLLERNIEESLRNGRQPASSQIACLASYKALSEYPWISSLSELEEIKPVYERQVLEPRKEEQLRLEILILQEISDSISSKVREQYEENPYPRWVNTELAARPESISTETKKCRLKITNTEIYKVDAPQILIAGAGTGQQSIYASSRFEGSNILAVDLSLSSLSYAKRKTEELGVTNIEYMQADILDLEKLNMKFDMIECSGVLHHMEEPLAGWRVLVNCLKTGGLMKIGLYSEQARTDIVDIHKEINQSNIGQSTAAMKAFRNKLINSPLAHHKKVSSFPDFYSLSMFRDLLFHAQEHRFTVPELKICLTELGLEFCGFEGDRIVQNFVNQNLAKDDLYDLEKWAKFEEHTCYAFLGMYQFWCQKAT